MDQMGWYANISGAISTVTSSGTFNLAAIGLDPSSASGTPFMLKIAKPNTSDLYYLSYRQPVGNYNQLSTTYTKGINIHRYKGSGYGYTTHVKTLIDGETFTDTSNGISFTQVSQDNGFATVQVSYGCAANTPAVSISPATLAMASGNSANFTVTVSNKDMSGCSNTTFTLDHEGGVVNGSLASPDLTLSPSQTGSSILTADTYLSEGSYSLSVFVTDSDGRAPHHTGISSANATLVIDNTPPSTPANLSGSSNKQGNIALSWQASSDALSGVAGYLVYRNNEVIGETTSNGFTDSTVIAGVSYEYAVSARDKADNSSTVSSIILLTAGNSSGGGKGGGKK
ncbi:MAG: fibronectin type III domain-containing protein [Nitrosomonas sp.]|nr:fibronectin type III domain-containing protein [Nitrosomonas sp.]